MENNEIQRLEAIIGKDMVDALTGLSEAIFKEVVELLDANDKASEARDNFIVDSVLDKLSSISYKLFRDIAFIKQALFQSRITSSEIYEKYIVEYDRLNKPEGDQNGT